MLQATCLYLSAIVCPVQHSLALFATALEIARFAILFDLRDVALDSLPTFDLTLIVRGSTTHVVTAVPFKPAMRILFVNPAFGSPICKRHAGTDAKEIKFGMFFFVRRESDAGKPRFGVFFGYEIINPDKICAAKDSDFQHFTRC